MATNTLSRIFGPAAVASGTSTIFTGTTAHTYSFKRFRIVNTDTVNAITIKLGIGGVAAANLILPPITIDAGGYLDDEGLTITAGTETLQANTSAAGLTMSGHGLDQS